MRAVDISPTIPLIVTKPIAMAPAPTPVARSQPTAISLWPECPLPSEATKAPTQAAVQRFEGDLTFCLQGRAEIWTFIASPLQDRFYWRVLPSWCSEGKPDCTWMSTSGIYELTDERGIVYQFVGAGGIAKMITP